MFLQEAFLHHLTRKDPRHNFSVYFYHIYLTYMKWPSHVSTAARPVQGVSAVSTMSAVSDPSTSAFLPQMVLILALSVSLHKHLPFCWLTQTMAFVAFNKVSTAQYFVWYYCLLPLVLPNLPWPMPRRLQAALGGWVAAQLHWLLWGYLLEFQGLGVFLGLWFASLVFLAANTWLMVTLLQCFSCTQSFLALSIEHLQGISKQKLK